MREGEYAVTVSRRLFAAAPAVILSWPGQIDAAPLRPSPLLRGFPNVLLQLPPSVAPALAISCSYNFV